MEGHRAEPNHDVPNKAEGQDMGVAIREAVPNALCAQPDEYQVAERVDKLLKHVLEPLLSSTLRMNTHEKSMGAYRNVVTKVVVLREK